MAFVSMSFVCFMISSAETDTSQKPESDSSSSFDEYTGSGSVQDKALLRKQDWRIIPLCALVYLLDSLDRSNIGIESNLVMNNSVSTLILCR